LKIKGLTICNVAGTQRPVTPKKNGGMENLFENRRWKVATIKTNLK
jgi:hypothetical protein